MGVIIASTILLLWTGHLWYTLEFVPVDSSSPMFYVHILFQAYLYTGLFITGHDAMHGTVSNNRRLNNLFGYVSVFLFAGMSYRNLVRKHGMHHQFPGTEKDPDYSSQSHNFWIWWFRFMTHYVTVLQLIIMALLFNIFKIWFQTLPLILFWILPAFLSTLQLFYFGTYLPHKRPHTEEMGTHKARSQGKNHLWAMLSCYFFGYHYEHHENPRIPWWKLYRLKMG